jgi:hypothetical protein
MKIRLISVVLAVIILAAWQSSAEAARNYTATQIPMPVELVMGSAHPITYRIANTNAVGGETMTRVRFNLANNTYTTLPNPETFVAPTGWTCTRSSNTRITCNPSNSTYYITPTNYKDFTFNINSAALTQDHTDQLSTVQARFSASGTTYYNPTSLQSSWTWRSLSMTLVPSTFNVGGGCQFTLTMTVTNKSTSAITGVTSVPKPPTLTGVSATTVSNPAAFNLNAGATGTMVWTYTAGVTAGTLTFTAYAQDSATTRKSLSVTTSTITISAVSCTLTTTILVTPACLFTGDTATFVMTVTNTTGATVTTVTPSALTKAGTAAIGTFTGPAPASIASIANGASGTFTWTAPVTGNVSDTYYVTGFATATGPLTTATATSNTEDVDGYGITVSPASTNVGSTNQELIWTITNTGCADVKQVQITVPAGWPVPVTDSYSVIDQFNPPNPGSNPIDPIENIWAFSTLGNTVTFAAPASPPNPYNLLPLVSPAKSGTFSLVFPTTPAATGTSSFQITITDTNNRSVTPPTTDVTVYNFNTSNPNNPNANDTDTIREDIR